MLKALKWLILLLIAIVAGIGIWGYAPDRKPADLRTAYGAAPSIILPLPNGQKVHVRDEGPKNAPVLLLIHGSNSSLHTWQGWSEQLKKDYRIIRYDQPGHGLTGPQVKHDYSAKSMSDTAAMVMEQLGIKRYVVVGNSMGGWVAWHHTLDYPQRVAGLVLVDASGSPDNASQHDSWARSLLKKPWGQKLFLWFTPRTLVEREYSAAVADPSKIRQSDIDRTWNLLRYPGNRQATLDRDKTPRSDATAAQMAQIQVPTMIIWGSKDRLTPVKGAEWFQKHIARSSLTIYKDLGHLPMEEAPGRSAGDLRQWLSDVGLNKAEESQDGSIVEVPDESVEPSLPVDDSVLEAPAKPAGTHKPAGQTAGSVNPPMVRTPE